MFFHVFLSDERRAAEAKGRIEGKLIAKRTAILELLEDLGTVSDSLQNRIMSKTDTARLTALHKASAKATSLEQFEEMIANL